MLARMPQRNTFNTKVPSKRGTSQYTIYNLLTQSCDLSNAPADANGTKQDFQFKVDFECTRQNGARGFPVDLLSEMKADSPIPNESIEGRMHHYSCEIATCNDYPTH